jgi:8-oxo-dGTP pyrophosphatase MutT (NUDIX family)
VISRDARAVIDAYDPVDPRERGFRERMLSLLELGAPFSRAQLVPGHLTASAFVISPAADELLLIFHRKLGIWVQPGGHIEPGDESLVAAARREVAEEVGLSLGPDVTAEVFDLDIHAIPARKDEAAHEHFDVRYCFHAPTLDFKASDEVADARWVPLRDLARLTTDESVLRAARKLAAGTKSLR